MIQTIPEKLLQAGLTTAGVRAFIQENDFPLVEGDRISFFYVGSADKVDLRHWINGLPSSIPLNQIKETDVWFRTMEFPESSRIEYKLGVTKGDHEEWLHDPLNPHVALDPFGGNSVVRTAGIQVPQWTRTHEKVPCGRIERFEIESDAFGDTREIGVYLPPNFRSYRRYRLLVVHDGDDYVKFSQLTTVLDNLIDAMEIPPLIVALSNPRRRLIEYANDSRHGDHIVKELIPEMQSRYSLIQEPSGRCLMGASFGGVASLATAWQHPDTFGSLLVQSGSFAFTDIGDHSRSSAFDKVVSFMNSFRASPGIPARKMFVSCGVYESLIYENRSLVPFLLAQGIDVEYVESRDGHNWENWRDRLRDGLTWLFPGPLWYTYL